MQTFTVHTIESASEQSRPTLQALTKKFGFLPNVMATMAVARTKTYGTRAGPFCKDSVR
jgi:hypothetical protein